jgi:hypothetical protein
MNNPVDACLNFINSKKTLIYLPTHTNNKHQIKNYKQ